LKMVIPADSGSVLNGKETRPTKVRPKVGNPFGKRKEAHGNIHSEQNKYKSHNILLSASSARQRANLQYRDTGYALKRICSCVRHWRFREKKGATSGFFPRHRRHWVRQQQSSQTAVGDCNARERGRAKFSRWRSTVHAHGHFQQSADSGYAPACLFRHERS